MVLLIGATAGCSHSPDRSASNPPAPREGHSDYGSAPDFALPNVAGGRYELAQQVHAHHVVVLSFVAADCREECPKVEAILRSTAQRLAARSARDRQVEIATVELDPQTNSVPTVRQLRSRLWPQRGWAFLRGTPAQTTSVLHAYGVVVEPRKAGRDIVHSSYVYVINDRLRQVDLLAPDVNLTATKLISAVDATFNGQPTGAH